MSEQQAPQAGEASAPGGVVHRLVLLRHAKAEPGGSGPDHQRALALNGRDQAVAVGEAFVASGLKPELVLCSSALRTRQTWDLVSSRLPWQPRLRVLDDLYSVTVRELLAIVRDVSEEVGTVLVVGHEPTMAAASGFFAGPGSDSAALAQAHVGLPTSAYGVLDGDLPWAQWDRDAARLVYLGRPERRRR